MSAPKGNKYWQLASNPGRPKKYSPRTLWKKFNEYCKWIDENPFYEAVIVQKGITVENEKGEKKTSYQMGLPKMRPYTLTGFQIYANISHETWANYCKEEEFLEVSTRIKDICFTQKLEGAASGFFNSNIIARDLGLVDKQKNEIEGNMFLELMRKATDKDD